MSWGARDGGARSFRGDDRAGRETVDDRGSAVYEVPMPFVTKHFHYTRLLGDPEVETTLALFKVLDAGTLVAVVRPPVTEMGEDPSTWRVDCATATPAIRAHLKAYLPTHKLEYFEAASFADWYDNGTYEEMPWP